MDNQQGNISSSPTMEATVFDKVFRDDEGNLVIAQKPNLPVLVGLTALLLKSFVPNTNNLWIGLDTVALGALFTWGWMELFQGVNYFRRTLGLLILLGMIASRLSW